MLWCNDAIYRAKYADTYKTKHSFKNIDYILFKKIISFKNIIILSICIS